MVESSDFSDFKNVGVKMKIFPNCTFFFKIRTL